jgi:hypothetical protein
MPRKSSAGDRLLLLTLTLDAAVTNESWAEVSEILKARGEIADSGCRISEKTLQEIGQIEERILTTLRRRLLAVKGDMRNLATALRIASPYVRGAETSSFSLAG